MHESSMVPVLRLHMIEETIEGHLPFSPFTRERFALVSRNRDGSLVTTETRLFEPAVSRRRNLYKLVPELKDEHGRARTDTEGGDGSARLDGRVNKRVILVTAVFRWVGAAEMQCWCWFRPSRW